MRVNVFLKAGEKKLKTVSTGTPSSNHCFTQVYRSIFAKLYLYHLHKPKLQPALCYRHILLLSPISPLDVGETELWMNEVVQYWCISSFGHHKLHPKPSSCGLTPSLRNTYPQQYVTAAPLTYPKSVHQSWTSSASALCSATCTTVSSTSVHPHRVTALSFECGGENHAESWLQAGRLCWN